MSKTKWFWAAGLLLVALVGGAFFSGWLVRLLLKVEVPLSWNTYYQYVMALGLPDYQAYAGRIKAAGYIGFGIPVVLWMVVFYFIARTHKPSMHGDARFAHGGDLRKAGMFKAQANGILVGKYRGDLVRLGGQQFVILAAPTRSGKGVGVVIPNLLDYQESMVVLDIKQENYELTSGWRASQGHEIYLFNPFAEDRRSHRWNPLSYVSKDPSFRVSDLMSIAAMLYPDGADDQKFWVSQARNAFMAFTLYLCEKWEHDEQKGLPLVLRDKPTLGAVYRLSSGDGTDLRQLYQWMSQQPFLSGNAQSAFANLLSQANETFASILGTFKEPLNAWINPVLDAATGDDDFLLTDVRKKRMTIYIGIQPNKLAESRLIVNLFFSQLINLNTRELPRSDPTLKHQCLLLMDEFTAIGRLDILPTAIAFIGGYNLRLLPVIQSMAQLDATYGKDAARTLLTNHALQVLFAPREQRDANDYSEMLGTTTVRRQNVTRGREVSRSESLERRALMLPQELKALGDDRQVLLCEGLAHPVLCDKIRYYRERRFKARLLPHVDVPVLRV